MSDIKQSIDHEVNFWKEFVKTERFLGGWVADIPTPELRQKVRDFIKENLPENGEILDVGSGVVSILNGTVNKDRLIACDPLSEYYQRIFDYSKYDIDPPKPYPAEELPYTEKFKIVHISNALDHCQDPVKAFDKLWQAVEKGGYLIIQGFENEAEFENWSGFHQWNLSLSGNDLIISGKIRSEAVARENVIHSEKMKLDSGKNWFIWIAKK